MSKAEVDAWIGNVKARGVKSIICLLAEDQLPYYGELETERSSAESSCSRAHRT